MDLDKDLGIDLDELTVSPVEIKPIPSLEWVSKIQSQFHSYHYPVITPELTQQKQTVYHMLLQEAPIKSW